MDQWTRQVKVTRFLRALLKPFFARFFNFTYEEIGLEDGYLLLANHTMDYDPIFMGMAAGPLRYVASEHITRKGLGSWFLKYFFDPITIKKGSLAAGTTMDMMRSLKCGKPVCLFPEGNRCFNGVTGSIPAVTGKLAQKCRVPVVTYRIEGGYLTQPRWGTSLRRGKLTGHVVGIYYPEDLRALKADAISEMIRRDLHVDAYDSRMEKVAHKGKNPALGLETAIFCCPACQKIGHLQSDSTKLRCSCGFEASYDELGYLQPERLPEKADTVSGLSIGLPYTVTQLDLLQRETLSALIQDQQAASRSDRLWSDQVKVMEIGEDHEVIREWQGPLETYVDRVSFAGTDYPMEMIQGVAVHSRNGLTVHFGPNKKHLEISGERFWNALKYLYLYNLLEGKEFF